MAGRQRLLINLIAAVITFCLLYGIVAIFIYNDFLTSLIPGWHKTVYSMAGSLRFTIFVGACTLLTYFIFKVMLRFLTMLWSEGGS